jgi:hypothetical protein
MDRCGGRWCPSWRSWPVRVRWASVPVRWATRMPVRSPSEAPAAHSSTPPSAPAARSSTMPVYPRAAAARLPSARPVKERRRHSDRATPRAWSAAAYVCFADGTVVNWTVICCSGVWENVAPSPDAGPISCPTLRPGDRFACGSTGLTCVAGASYCYERNDPEHQGESGFLRAAVRRRRLHLLLRGSGFLRLQATGCDLPA